MATTAMPAVAIRRWTRVEYERLVEGATRSYRMDRRCKAGLYGRAGVPEYWIIDLPRETVEIRRRPEPSIAALYGWHYSRVATLRAPAIVAPLSESARPIPVADL